MNINLTMMVFIPAQIGPVYSTTIAFNFWRTCPMPCSLMCKLTNTFSRYTLHTYYISYFAYVS